MTHPLITALITTFREHANPTIAIGQAAYMRDQFPFLGIPTPTRRTIQQPLFKQHFLQSSELSTVIQQLWNLPEREFQYAAHDLALRYHKMLTLEHMPLFRDMVITKSWWDTVDGIATNLIGKLLYRNPTHLKLMDEWITDENLWIRRSAIICHMRWKKDTDYERLFAFCKQTMHEKDFFIRKAIGWALREYAKHHPQRVQAFITTHATDLSALSKKEASKYL